VAKNLKFIHYIIILIFIKIIKRLGINSTATWMTAFDIVSR
jgi:hypothetical protein